MRAIGPLLLLALAACGPRLEASTPESPPVRPGFSEEMTRLADRFDTLFGRDRPRAAVVVCEPDGGEPSTAASQARAEAIVALLVDRGVPAGALEAHGTDDCRAGSCTEAFLQNARGEGPVFCGPDDERSGEPPRLVRVYRLSAGDRVEARWDGRQVVPAVP